MYPFLLVRDGDPARVDEVAALKGLCLRCGRCGAYLLVLYGSGWKSYLAEQLHTSRFL